MPPTKKLPIIDTETLPESHFANVHGKKYILHQGLLSLAHEHGPVNITVDIVSYNGVGNEAVCTATVSGPRGTFSEVGDAAPENTKLRTATLRLAATRAVNRACRLYLGIGMTSREEMPDEDTTAPRPAPANTRSHTPTPKPPARKRKYYGNWDGKTIIDTCPDCGGPTWDNREDRKSAKAPIFKCRNKDECGWLVWPPKDKPQVKQESFSESADLYNSSVPGDLSDLSDEQLKEIF